MNARNFWRLHTLGGCVSDHLRPVLLARSGMGRWLWRHELMTCKSGMTGVMPVDY